MGSGGGGDRGASAATPMKLLVGRNARRLRRDGHTTQRQMAEALTQLGLRWSTTRYAQLEAGEVTITVPVLLLLAAAFGRIRPGVRLSDLLAVDDTEGEEWVELTPECAAPAEAVARILAEGSPPEELARHAIVREQVPAPEQEGAEDGYTHADWRVARQLGLGKAAMLALSRELWGRSLTQERDRRLGEHPTSLVERSRMTAELRGQLAEELSRRLPGYQPAETPKRPEPRSGRR